MKCKSKFLIVIFLVFSFALSTFSAFPQSALPQPAENDTIKLDAISSFYVLNRLIRDSKIGQPEAQQILDTILAKAKQDFISQNANPIEETENWVFPLQNHDYKSIGGRNGSGYMVSKFDFFDFLKPGGHPAHDIFIRDKNQDCLDDYTLQPVGVLSVTSGIVISIETCWTPDSIWKGGKHIHIYDPQQECIFYYAHNDTVLVRVGDIVQPGTLIAYVGRTGLNAYAKRSPTHLHFAQLKLDEKGYPRPRNTYKDLLKAKTIVGSQ